MLFKRYKISKLKVQIWEKIRYLNYNADRFGEATSVLINAIYKTYNRVTGDDPEIVHCSKEIYEFYSLSLKLVTIISDNLGKDTRFRCLRIVTNLLVHDLWGRAFIGGGKLDAAVIKNVEEFLKVESRTVDQMLLEISKERDYLGEINLLQKQNPNGSTTLDSTKKRLIETQKVIYACENELNSFLEAQQASNQRDSIDSTAVISNFNYADEVAKHNEYEVDKITKANKEHYEFVRSKNTEKIIEKQKEEKQLLFDEDFSINSESLFDRINLALNQEVPDLVGAYANLRHEIDNYMKYELGIDLCTYKNRNIEIEIDNKVVKASSSDILKAVFAPYENGYLINKIWDRSSEVMHGGVDYLMKVDTEDGVNKVREDIKKHYKVVNDIIGDKVNKHDYEKGVTLLYMRKYTELKNHIAKQEANSTPEKPYDISKDKFVESGRYLLKNCYRYLSSKEGSSKLFEIYPFEELQIEH